MMKNVLRLVGVIAAVGCVGLGVGGSAIDSRDLVKAVSGPGAHVYIGEQLPAGFYENLFAQSEAGRLSVTPREKNLTDYPSNDIDPAWSPEGDTIMFSSNGVDSDGNGKFDAVGDNQNLWTIRLDGSQLRQVTTDSGNETEPAWSPTGREVAFISDRTGQPQVFVKDLGTGTEVQVTAGAPGAPGNKSHPTWGTLGIAFVCDRTGNLDLWMVQSDGSNLTRLTYSPADDKDPAFALDNLSIGFSSNRAFPPAPGGNFRIYTIPSSNATLPEDQKALEPGLNLRTSGGGAANDTEPRFRLRDGAVFFTSDRAVNGAGSDLNVWRGSRGVNPTGPGIQSGGTPWDQNLTIANLVENFRPGDEAADTGVACSLLPSSMAEDWSGLMGAVVESNRTGNWDLWSIVPDMDDHEPPRLMSLPTETPKVAAAGVPVTIRVNVEDNFDYWRQMANVIMGSYDLGAGTFTDGSPVPPPPAYDTVAPLSDAAELMGIALDDIIARQTAGDAPGTCTVTVTGTNQNDAPATWTGVADYKKKDDRFAFTPAVAGDRCKDIANITVLGTANVGRFEVRAFGEKITDTALRPVVAGTSSVQAVLREPYEFAGSGYGTVAVQSHTDCPAHAVTDKSILLQSPWANEWIGRVSAPEAGRIDLKDDGVAPDEVAGDGIYTGTWTPPRAIDYLMDIEVRDVAGNSFIYDNVGGLSRAIFNPTVAPAILLVFDWTEGQRWTSPLTLTRNAQSRQGVEFVTEYSFAPTEMYWTGHSGTRIVPGDPDAPPTYADLPGTVYLNDSIWDDNHLNNWHGGWVPRDIWRTQCRGPLPRTVLAAYAPRIQMQPNPTDPAFRPTRPVASAQSAVVWAAPYSGDEWVQPGSIIDLETQNNLTWFVENGGRLWVSGQDVAWALTADGTKANAFMSTVLYATYAKDNGNDPSIGGVLDGSGPLSTDSADSDYAWPDYLYAEGVNTTPTWAPPTPLFLTGAVSYLMPVTTTGGDGANDQARPDAVTAIAPAGVHYVFRPREGVESPGAAGTYIDRTTQVGVKTRTAFSTFGLEGIHRAYKMLTFSVRYKYCLNYRGKVWHDFICWLTTWRLSGSVIHNQGLAPIAKTLILVDPVFGADGKPTLQGSYTGISDEKGSFQIEGIPPGSHSVGVYAPGFFWHWYEWATSPHGQEDVSGFTFKLTEAEPGGISGTVTAKGSGAPIAGATVTATLIGFYLGQPLQVNATSDAKGYYEILHLPTGFYNVSGTAPNYGTDTVEQVRVDPGTVTKNVDLALPAAPGSLSGTVTDATTTNPIQNATIQAVAGAQVTGTATTDANGHYEIAQIVAGAHSVTASASGYSSLTKTVTIEPAQAKVLDFALSTVPPGSISGAVKEAATGLPSGGATVRVMSGTVEVASILTAADYTTVNGYSFNYQVGVPAGTYQVVVSKANRRAAPESRTESVVSQQETKNVNFDLEALYSFATGISLISFPYEYAAPADPAAILGIPQAQLTGNMAYWGGSAYVVYPTAPMDGIALGRGYFLRLTQAAIVETEGTPTASDPFVIPLHAGWNMIGDPFLGAVDWYSGVQVSSGANVYSIVDALAQGLLRGRLWSFDGRQYQLSLFLNPWVGNWVQAGQDVDLRVSAPARGISAVPNRAAKVAEGGWGLALMAGIGDAVDGVYIGSSPVGREGYDALDALKPPQIMGEKPIDVYFDESAWGSQSGRYAVEVKGDVSTGRKQWEFVVETGVKDGTAYVFWPDLKEVPRGVTLTLEDLDTGQRQDMRQSASYQFNSGSSGVRHLAVVAERRVAGVLGITGLSVSKASRGRTLSISLTLSQPAWVTVEVMNLGGESVRLVKTEEPLAAGQNEVVWDGRDERGALVPAGSYNCQVTAKDEAGEIVNAFRTFVIVW